MAVCRVDTSEGVVIAVAAVMALTVYLVAVGLDMGDELVGVGGLFPAAAWAGAVHLRSVDVSASRTRAVGTPRPPGGGRTP